MKIWSDQGKALHCSMYCFCKDCRQREITEGVDLEVWISVKNSGTMTKSGIINVDDPTDILLEFQPTIT